MTDQVLLSVINFMICSGIGFACVCRLNSDICRLYKVVRTRYTFIMTGATIFGFQYFFFGTHPDVAGVILSSCVFASIVLNMSRWPTLQIEAT